jgi:hypothetical protein
MPGVLDVWLHTLADLLVTVLIERMREGSRYMFAPKAILWGGVASVFGGLFWLVMVLAPSSGGAVSGLALALGLGGLVGLRSLQAGQGGRLGLAGFALGIIGTFLALAVLWWDSNRGPLLNSTSEIELALAARTPLILMLAIGTSGIGLALLGIASLRAKTLHGWRGLPLGLGVLHAIFGMTGWLVFYVPPLSPGRNPLDHYIPVGIALLPAVAVLIGLGWMGLGIMLAADANAQVAQPPPASA